MKEYWDQAERLRRRINRKINEIHVLRQRQRMNGTSSDAMPRSSSPDSKMDVTVFKIMALSRTLRTRAGVRCLDRRHGTPHQGG